jgi:hypothetical protein
MTVSKAAHSLQRAKGALAIRLATVDLNHATGHDHASSFCQFQMSFQTAGLLRSFLQSWRQEISLRYRHGLIESRSLLRSRSNRSRFRELASPLVPSSYCNRHNRVACD